MSNKTEFEKGYDEAIADAVAIVNIARENGETDLRQVRSWIERAEKYINEEDGEV
ncbi:TPA: hypothetical protein RD867_002012 [Listeria monocytogenes]|uniref:hypothetical protein n=1 Tax=Listeria monocytogenes TaxID=1639 RepID=UPI000442D11E|nr:hypothetical protein [Listeria monocytogenes]EDN9487706.1 hypothetical protein [Listeria monocytogenes]EDO1259797.1 hypothetical protein [Listeria monocytogenes]EZH68556.1 hypothetical protein T283_14325 [Listeria monocytogenes N53-1]NVQ56262.1 hypothetical protein [Listeria monocytogenes]HBL8325720.1 hypothetical protein [Listeria monocytogenes]